MPQYCKSDLKQPFVLPNVLERDPVVVPHDFVDSLLHARESQLSFKASISDLFQADYTSNSMAVGDLYEIVVKLIAKDMTNLLHSESIAKALSYEARAGLLEEWGNDTESWVKVPLCTSLERMCGRLVSLLAVGPETCKINIQEYI